MNKSFRICIISPAHPSYNPRVVKEANALAEAGFAVSVICGNYIPNAKKLDYQLAGSKWEITHVDFGRNETSTFVHLRQKLLQRIASILCRSAWLRREFSTIAHSQVALDLEKAASKVKADLYIAHYVAGLSAAAKSAKRHGARYAFDAEDFHLGDLPDLPKYDSERSLIREIEGKWLPGAAYVTSGSPLIAKAYADAYGIEIPKVILNVFSRVSGPSQPTPRGTETPAPSLYWFSQTIGAGRGLETALEAIAIAKSKPHLHLRGKPASGYRDSLAALASRLGVSDRLHFHDLLPPDELERAGANFDIGLVGEANETRNRDIALTNKLFSYLTSGIPIVASRVSAHSDIAVSLENAITLFDIGDSEGLAARIDALLNDQAALSDARKRSWTLGQTTFCWEAEAPMLVAHVRTACAAR